MDVGEGVADRLVVLLHGGGWRADPESLEGVEALARKIHPEADILVPSLPLGVLSFADLEIVAERLIQRIDEQNQRRTYQHITLVGHSMGGILARKLWVLAHGARFDGRVDLDRFDWSEKIDRVVLLAGMNRGWSVGSSMRWGTWLSFGAGAALGHVVSAVTLGRFEPVAFAVRRGAPFLTRMRLQWMEVDRMLGSDDRRPITIQLVGTSDDLVAPTDHIDLASGTSFHYVEIAGADHTQILEADQPLLDSLDVDTCGSTDASDWVDRIRKLCLAIHGRQDQIDPVESDFGDVRDLARETLLHTVEPAEQQLGEHHVVVLIHGIRDEGYWARRLGARIRDYPDAAGRYGTVTDSYGYFPMLPFIVPWTRRAKVEWLLDRLVAIKSRFPDATLHFVGHSNGTFLLAKALEVLPMRQLRFERVVIAGSVLPHDHRWPISTEGTGVGCVANYVATADWVVAIFPNGISLYGHVGELGGAGHYGFGGEVDAAGIDGAFGVWNVRWVKGQHSAALQERRWTEIASFVAGSGHDCSAVPSGLTVDSGAERSAKVVIAGLLSPLLIALLLLIVTALGWACVRPMSRGSRLLALGFAAWAGLVGIIAFVY